MIIKLGATSQFKKENLDFVTKPLGKRKKVLYQATLNKIQEYQITYKSRLIIPNSQPCLDYDFETLIAYIRLDSNELLAKIPIIVFFENENEYLNLFDQSREFQEILYEKIAVSCTPDPDDIGSNCDIDEIALQFYLNKVTASPYRYGSHDNTNRWGAYILTNALFVADAHNKEKIRIKKTLENDLLEEIYYKKLIQELQKDITNARLVEKLQTEILFFSKKFPAGKILIIEDQLDDGWRDAYQLFFSVSSSVEILFAANVNAAKTAVSENHDIDLILLDVRLDRHKDKNIDEIKRLSGVKLARWIRSKSPIVPIISATASNKSWTLESLLDEGINGYWVKGSPDYIYTSDLCAKNVLDLYRKINSTLKWAQRTGWWQQELYRIAQAVRNPQLSDRLLGKAQSLQSLLFRSFSPFSEKLSEGLQMNLAFLEIYSCLNDLAEWVCDIKRKDDGSIEWWLKGDDTGTPIVKRRLDKRNKYKWFLQDENDDYATRDFPDKKVSKQIIIKKQKYFKNQQLYHHIEFDNLSKIRNGLPLIHGKINSTGCSSKTIEYVEDKDIDMLIGLISEIVNHHLFILCQQTVV